MPRDTTVSELELSVRTTNCLIHAGITTLGEMEDFFRSRSKAKVIKELRHFGAKSYWEVMGVLNSQRPAEPDPREFPFDLVEEAAYRQYTIRNDWTIQTMCLVSSAISLRRIADSMQTSDKTEKFSGTHHWPSHAFRVFQVSEQDAAETDVPGPGWYWCGETTAPTSQWHGPFPTDEGAYLAAIGD